jgi:carbon-monoxide dehydrogenase large subunit
MSANESVATRGVGARLIRKEDDRYIRGHGEFVADIKMPGMLDVAFLRSTMAHARLRIVGIPPEIRSSVFVAGDLAGVKPIRTLCALPGYKASDQPILALDKVRFVGEPVAACVAANRAEAEDIVGTLTADFEELPVVHDMLKGRESGSFLLHEQWGDNIFFSAFQNADIESVARRAPIRVTRTIRTARQSMAPMEGRGVVAWWNTRSEQLTIYTSCHIPHVVRTGLSECLGIDQGNVRIVAPDVGGSFGYKGVLLAEEVVLGWLAMRLRRPVRWIEDRREALTAGANCREHHYVITGYAEADGTLLAVDAEATVDSGAYSNYPFSACLEASMVLRALPGLYDFPVYRCRSFAVATNKPPILPYRAVARPGVCLAMELIVDAIAAETGLEPYEVRLRNLVPPERMPFDNITKGHFDSGDYPECVRRAIETIDLPATRARQQRGEPDGRLIGFGMSVFGEQGAPGTAIFADLGIPVVPGYEQANGRLTPDGGLELRVGVQSHGQGMETTLAQIACEVLGIDPDKVKLVHGDTGLTPYSTGTWGSRCMVMTGGAVARVCQELCRRAARIGACLLQVDPSQVSIANGRVIGPSGSVSLSEVSHVWHLRPQDLPPDVDPGGLDVTSGYKARRDSGTFSYASHATVVAVDPTTGAVELLDYVVVEDGGVLINPAIVDGQVHGGVAQGIGTALLEEMPFDERGQPLASTLADYTLPGSMDVPEIRVFHMETPSPYSEFGQKGIGEGGAIGPPAAIVNAINDALRPLGARVSAVPATPQRILDAIAAAKNEQTPGVPARV